MLRRRPLTLMLTLAFLVAGLASLPPAAAIPNPVATDPASYAAFGRVFSDPQGCEAHDVDGDEVNDVVPPNVSPWAKGNMCMAQFLQYEEVIEGAKFMARTYPRFLQVIRLDQAYDNSNYISAGLPRTFVIDDGKPKALDRDHRPLYMFKVTDSESPIPESERLHFVFAGGVHGPERAGAEGAVRAMEDLVTWAAKYPDKKIVEAETQAPAPNAKEALERSVAYFILPNPDGWARGQVAPTEFEDGSPNLNYTPGATYQRYNGNGMDLNRDLPTFGYSYRPYTPGSEPETKAYVEVLRGIRKSISPNNPVGQRFAGGIDLHGQLTASAFSYTLLGAGQRDYRKNFSTVDQGLRAWEDQTGRLAWSPYMGTPVAPVADQWGTVIDTIGYQITGGYGDFFENEEIGLGGVGIDNEMSLSHLAPNTVFEPILEQMHIDGNKGLIYSQMASMLTETEFVYEPAGKIGYVFNPVRVEHDGNARAKNPGLPAQDDIDVLVPCQSAGPQNVDAALPCGGGTFGAEGIGLTLEFDVHGPDRGIWNGGIFVTVTHPHVLGHSASSIGGVQIQRLDPETDEWATVASDFNQSFLYAQAGQGVATNDPIPGRYRVLLENAAEAPARIQVDFRRTEAEESPGQAPFSASSMDFFAELNKYIAGDAMKAEKVTVAEVAADPATLNRFDSVVVVNKIGDRDFLQNQLGHGAAEADAYFAGLRSFAEGGGNLVLTDAALRTAAELGLVALGDVKSNRVLAARYSGVCNDNDPLEKDVCLPGTAGGNSRQAVEPTPLGYSPDTGFDSSPQATMPQWGITGSAWSAEGGSTSATNAVGAALGVRPAGQGRVVIAGGMFPDPNYAPGGPRDMRFGVASYALTFSNWQVFLNTVNYAR